MLMRNRAQKSSRPQVKWSAISTLKTTASQASVQPPTGRKWIIGVASPAVSDDLSAVILEQLNARGATTSHLALLVDEPVETVLDVLHDLVRRGQVVGGPDFWQAAGLQSPRSTTAR